MNRTAFVARYGGIYEHSPWVAEETWDAHDGELGPEALADAMAACVDRAGNERKLALINAHPDLAGRAAVGGELTTASSAEQSSAGIDQCTPEEYDRFTDLNARYKARFGFPFIMAVRGSNRHAILAAFEERLDNDRDAELRRAIAEIHKIARLRLEALDHGEGAGGAVGAASRRELSNRGGTPLPHGAPPPHDGTPRPPDSSGKSE